MSMEWSEKFLYLKYNINEASNTQFLYSFIILEGTLKVFFVFFDSYSPFYSTHLCFAHNPHNKLTQFNINMEHRNPCSHYTFVKDAMSDFWPKTLKKICFWVNGISKSITRSNEKKFNFYFQWLGTMTKI